MTNNMTYAEVTTFKAKLASAIKGEYTPNITAKQMEKAMNTPTMKMDTNVMTQRALMVKAHKTARKNHQLATQLDTGRTYRECLSQAMKDMHISIKTGRITQVTNMPTTIRSLLKVAKDSWVRFEYQGNVVVIARREHAQEQVMVGVNYGSGHTHRQVLWLKTLKCDCIKSALERIVSIAKDDHREETKQKARVKYKLVKMVLTCSNTYSKRFK